MMLRFDFDSEDESGSLRPIDSSASLKGVLLAPDS
jgi:hypothetical protein